MRGYWYFRIFVCMKPLLLSTCSAELLLTAILLFLPGCSFETRILNQAEEIVALNPDSALVLLGRLRNPDKKLSARNFARYARMHTEACWRKGVDLRNDTLIDVALDYYRVHTDDSIAASDAFYYAGKIAHRRQLPEEAITLLLSSRELLPPGQEYRRHYIVETWLGVICGEQQLFKYKLQYARRALAYADSLDNPSWRCISLGDMAHAYMGIAQYDSMARCASEALRIAREHGIRHNTDQQYSILCFRAVQQKRWADAEVYCREGIRRADSAKWHAYLINLIEIKNGLEQYDSARYYADCVMKIGYEKLPLASRGLRSYYLASTWEKKGDLKRALNELYNYCNINDSIADGIHSEQAENAQQRWYFGQLRDQNTRLKLQKERGERRLWGFVIGCIVLLSAVGWGALRIWHVNKLRLFRQQKQILDQQRLLVEMHRKEDALRIAFFRQLNRQFLLRPDIPGQRRIRLTDQEWKIIFDQADAIFNNFTQRLRTRFPALNDEDIRYCCMVRMQLSQAEIAGIVCLERDSVKKRLKRIRTEKMHVEGGRTLEDILCGLDRLSPSAKHGRIKYHSCISIIYRKIRRSLLSPWH